MLCNVATDRDATLGPAAACCTWNYFSLPSYSQLDAKAAHTPENAARALDLYNALAGENAAEDPPSDGFLLSIQPEHVGTQLWMRDDVTGDPEHVIQFVKRCGKEFSLTGL